MGRTSHCGAVLVVDDDPSARELMSALLAGVGLSAVEAASGEEALALAGGAAAAIVDVRLPGISGVEVCKRLRARDGDLPILLVSGERTEPLDRAFGLRLGADDYLVKPFDPDELLARVEAVMRRARSAARALPQLTGRELEVLGLVREGLTDAAIGERLSISRKTVGAHVSRIYEKLGVHSRVAAVTSAYRENLFRQHEHVS